MNPVCSRLNGMKRKTCVEAFTPDFYLPEQNLFIELTTLRSRLATHKNRKIRRLKELYPEINIKLFKRREMRDLMVKFGLEEQAEQIQGDKTQIRNNTGENSVHG